VITVGSLGTLTLNVMAMTRLLKARKSPASTRLPVVATLLLAAATIVRVRAGYAIEGCAHAAPRRIVGMERGVRAAADRPAPAVASADERSGAKFQ
jgi:hypothetical protein